MLGEDAVRELRKKTGAELMIMWHSADDMNLNDVKRAIDMIMKERATQRIAPKRKHRGLK